MQAPLSSIKLGQTPCGYCFSNWATEYDHLTPRSAGGLTVSSNLFPSCKRCNCILGNLIFDTLEEKRNYVQERLKKKGIKLLSSLPQEIRGKKKLAKILLFKVPLGDVGSVTSENDEDRPITRSSKIIKRKRRNPTNKINYKAPYRRCAYFQCGKYFMPLVEDQKYHHKRCGIIACHIRKTDLAKQQEKWELTTNLMRLRNQLYHLQQSTKASAG